MMSVILDYAQLTWPEVAALPRSLPLVIPLGNGYPTNRVFERLGMPERAGILPAIPFGWQESGLKIADHLLGAYLINLLNSLRDDGFSQVYALTPPGPDYGLGPARITLPPLASIAGNCLPSDEDRGKVILIPIGHTEQHGHHLPLSTDSDIIQAIAEGVAQAAPDKVARLPVMPYGVSTHRPSFAGTLNAGGRAFEDFWLGVIDVLVARGFDRFYLISGHGGNCSFLVNVVKYAGERYRRIFCSTSWLYLSGTQGVATLQERRRSGIGGMGHACELETALMLHIRPELVRMDKVVDEMDFIATPSYFMDWVEGGALVANPPWDDDTRTGAYGAGSLATRENGEYWLKAAISEKVIHIDEIHDQYTRREARRQAGYGLWGKNNCQE